MDRSAFRRSVTDGIPGYSTRFGLCTHIHELICPRRRHSQCNTYHDPRRVPHSQLTGATSCIYIPLTPSRLGLSTPPFLNFIPTASVQSRVATLRLYLDHFSTTRRFGDPR